MTTALEAARTALDPERTWLVGGALRDRLIDRPTADIDLALDGDVAVAARTLARAARATAFPLSEQFGAWRVVARDHAWHADLMHLQGASIEDDLARRDFTVNAMAEPLAGGPLLDPHGGRADLAAGVLRAVGAQALTADPLRALRLVRFATELGLAPDPATAALARASAPRLSEVSGERVFAELRRIVCAPEAPAGLERMSELGLTAVVLPELEALRGVGQGVYHHLDVHDHTLAVLAAAIALERDPAPLEPHAAAAAAVLAEPLAGDLTRGQALRFAALLHDIAKPLTRQQRADGKIVFPAHDIEGARMVRDILARLRTGTRLTDHVAALTRNHLRVGFLVHARPLSRRRVHEYLTLCAPVEMDVTVLSVADRLATRGRKADVAIAAHLELARELLGEALDHRSRPPLPPLLRGDELAGALALEPGPVIGRLQAELAAARFAGEVSTPAQALAHARAWLARDGLDSASGV